MKCPKCGLIIRFRESFKDENGDRISQWHCLPCGIYIDKVIIENWPQRERNLMEYAYNETQTRSGVERHQDKMGMW